MVAGLILASLTVLGPVAAQEAPVVTLDEAITTAVANNPGLAIARERVQRAENQLREARGQSRFRINIDSDYSRTGPRQTFTIPGPGGEEQTIEASPESQLTASATASQPIDISGRLSLIRQLAMLQLDIQTFDEARTLQRLILDVKEAYYNVLRSEGAVDVAQASLDVAEERLRLARARFEAGVVARFDVTRAEVDVANLRQTLIEAQANVEIAKGVMNTVIGLNANQPTEVQGQAVPIEPVTVDIEAQTNLALDARPEIRQALLGVDLAQRNVRFTAKEDEPSLAAFARTNWRNETSAFQPNQTTYTIGANVTWPIWTGGVTQARVAQARNDEGIARQNLDQATLGVTLDVRTAAENVMESSRRVETAEANVELAREALRLATIRYEEGVATEVEVIDAEAALTQALTNLVNSRYDYLTALAQLQRATATQPEYERLTSAAPSVPQGEDK